MVSPFAQKEPVAGDCFTLDDGVTGVVTGAGWASLVASAGSAATGAGLASVGALCAAFGFLPSAAGRAVAPEAAVPEAAAPEGGSASSAAGAGLASDEGGAEGGAASWAGPRSSKKTMGLNIPDVCLAEARTERGNQHF